MAFSLLLGCSGALFAADKAPPGKPINLEITTHLGDHQVFRSGDKLSFYISLDHDAYLYAFYRDASGALYQLLPGPVQQKHFFTAGFYIPFPADNAAFEFVVQAPFGKESVYLFASSHAQLQLAKTPGFQLKHHSMDSIRRVLQTPPHALLGEARVNFTSIKN